MGQTTLVERLSPQVNRFVAEAIDRGVDIRAYGWAQTSQYGWPYLFLVSPQARGEQEHAANDTIQSILRGGGKVWLRLSETQLVEPTDRLARELLSIAERIPDDGDPSPVVHHATDLGGVEIFGPAYIYPVPKPAQAPATGS